MTDAHYIALTPQRVHLRTTATRAYLSASGNADGSLTYHSHTRGPLHVALCPPELARAMRHLIASRIVRATNGNSRQHHFTNPANSWIAREDAPASILALFADDVRGSAS